jgi:uncharacterized membrane protein YcaP (DUF421 family)
MQDFGNLFLIDPLSLGLIALRTVVVYVALLVLMRLAGKREIGQMTAFDLVVLLVISNAVQNAMIGPDNSLNGGLLAVVCLLVVNRLVDRLGMRSRWLQRSIVGEPTLLVHDGALLESNLAAEGVSHDEVLQALREHGLEELSLVKVAVLEVDGTISVVPYSAATVRTRRRVRGRKPTD